MGFVSTSVDIVELVAMAMALVHEFRLISELRDRVFGERTWLSTESHGPSHVGDIPLFIEQTDHRIRSVFVKFSRIGPIQSQHIATKLHRSAHCMPKQIPKKGISRSRA